jgi:hypothetical protein
MLAAHRLPSTSLTFFYRILIFSYTERLTHCFFPCCATEGFLEVIALLSPAQHLSLQNRRSLQFSSVIHYVDERCLLMYTQRCALCCKQLIHSSLIHLRRRARRLLMRSVVARRWIAPRFRLRSMLRIRPLHRWTPMPSPKFLLLPIKNVTLLYDTHWSTVATTTLKSPFPPPSPPLPKIHPHPPTNSLHISFER